MAVAPPVGPLADLARRRAEWQPWLRVLDVVGASARDAGWRAAVPDAPSSTGDTVPLLAGMTLTVPARRLRRWMRDLGGAAAAAGGAAATLATIAGAEIDWLASVLEAGLAQDDARVTALAEGSGADPAALGAVAAVAPVPLLRACAGRWAASVSPAWEPGFCPICGAWPAFAEARGLERARRLRCVRCAGDWRIAWLRCPYCGVDDHQRLGALVVTATSGATDLPARVATTVDTCASCRGYLKTVTTLGPTPADDLALLDLATVELDVAAVDHGYRRPAGPGTALGARVTAARTGPAGWWHA